MEGAAAYKIIQILDSLKDGLTGQVLDDKSVGSYVSDALRQLDDLSNIFKSTNTGLYDNWIKLKESIKKLCLLLNTNTTKYIAELHYFCKASLQNDKEIYEVMIKTNNGAQEILNSLGIVGTKSIVFEGSVYN